jgi:hypothetical protein
VPVKAQAFHKNQQRPNRSDRDVQSKALRFKEFP